MLAAGSRGACDVDLLAPERARRRALAGPGRRRFPRLGAPRGGAPAPGAGWGRRGAWSRSTATCPASGWRARRRPPSRRSTRAGLLRPLPDLPGRCAAPPPEVLAAHVLVHGLGQHGYWPASYSLLKMVADLIDLGGLDLGGADPGRAAAWVARDVSAADEAAAVRRLMPAPGGRRGPRRLAAGPRGGAAAAHPGRPARSRLRRRPAAGALPAAAERALAAGPARPRGARRPLPLRRPDRRRSTAPPATASATSAGGSPARSTCSGGWGAMERGGSGSGGSSAGILLGREDRPPPAARPPPGHLLPLAPGAGAAGRLGAGGQGVVPAAEAAGRRVAGPGLARLPRLGVAAGRAGHASRTSGGCPPCGSSSPCSRWRRRGSPSPAIRCTSARR